MTTEAPRHAFADTVSSSPGPDPLAATSAGDLARPGAPTEGLTGARLDHFAVGELLGTGGMGAVYTGRDLSLDRAVAIKVLRDAAGASDVHEQRFLREARVQASLNHPNVVHIYYIGRRPAEGDEAGSLFFAMELVDGDTLDDVIDADETLEPEQARRTMIEVVRGLRAGHQAGIIHRDVKPGNILRAGGDSGRVKIADFGLARPIEQVAEAAASDEEQVDIRSKRLTQDGMIVGSPWYIAPEQAAGQTLDHRADMYSLGATFYHLLSGRPVFDADAPFDVVMAHLSQPHRSLAEVAPDVPPKLAAIVDRLLAKDPADRYEDYDALLAALDEAAPRQEVFAGFWTRAAATLLDGGIAAALIFLIGWPGLVLHVIHVTAGHAWHGQSLGKYLLRVEVRDVDDHGPIGLARSLMRTIVGLWLPFAALITVWLTGGHEALIAVIERVAPHHLGEIQDTMVLVGSTMGGFLTLLYFGGLGLAAMNSKKRALHDLVVGSVVLYRL